MGMRIVAATVMAISALLVVSAQGTREREPENAAIAALVAELRAIRTELSEASQRSLRFQLLLARVQLQEQRIGHLDRQRAEIAKTLMDTQTASAFMTQFQHLERACQDAVGDERIACEAQLSPMRAAASAQQAREQQLRMQEQELMHAIATEQGRWTEFSGRLDELERALARPR